MIAQKSFHHKQESTPAGLLWPGCIFRVLFEVLVTQAGFGLGLSPLQPCYQRADALTPSQADTLAFVFVFNKKDGQRQRERIPSRLHT